MGGVTRQKQPVEPHRARRRKERTARWTSRRRPRHHALGVMAGQAAAQFVPEALIVQSSTSPRAGTGCIAAARVERIEQSATARMVGIDQFGDDRRHVARMPSQPKG